MSREYLLPTPAYQNLLLIYETGNKWRMCKSVYMEVSGGQNELSWDTWLVPFFPRKKFLVNSEKERVVFENKKEPYR